MEDLRLSAQLKQIAHERPVVFWSGAALIGLTTIAGLISLLIP